MHLRRPHVIPMRLGLRVGCRRTHPLQLIQRCRFLVKSGISMQIFVPDSPYEFDGLCACFTADATIGVTFLAPF
ncbi:hypothetical protein DACRYDRAFT_23248 [Dacryopinax primogenitus]|uniref:Uncharacterized protein n=1 Tax=Dacryopinax primogenitus (strain DJM 731) TaxID=1858805 RepID=M5FX59_DACPD|nr:uncharacterized protein DACRYDRAFT_23248 [Dacryopinax primogenitus]EJU00325.1 hypothetical protein DACRYDRAFT_23248 [Dacryopinax primogenitus]